MTLLKREAIILDAEIDNPIDAIKRSGELLVTAGYANDAYTKAMIKGFKEVGPYIVIAPGIAIPHARPEDGALQSGFSLIRLKHSIKFGHKKNDPVKIVCAITGVGNTGHLEMLQKIAAILGDRNKHKLILDVSSFEELQDVITI